MRKVVGTKIKYAGEIPSARFGHTFTMVSKTKAVLFGGAVSDNGKYVITNDTYLFDFVTHKWKKIVALPSGPIPSERAAHAAACIAEMQLAVYGGTASTPQGPLKDQLYILDLRKEPYTWRVVQLAKGSTSPGQRYGHTMVYSKPVLIVFGGNTGTKVENDVWMINPQSSPTSWSKYEFSDKNMPCPRVYHSSAVCEVGAAAGMMIVFGGRKDTKSVQSNEAALNDVWGLRRHRNGTWDWCAPQKLGNYTPVPRYQHLISFYGKLMVVVGGRVNSPEESTYLIEAFNMESMEWGQVESLSRHRHAIVSVDNTLFVHGGLQPEMPSIPVESMIAIDLNKIRGLFQQSQNVQPMLMSDNSQQGGLSNRMLISQGIDNSRRELREIQRNTLSNNSRVVAAQNQKERALTPTRMLNSARNIKLSNQAFRATSETNQIQKVLLTTLTEESKRLTQQPKNQEEILVEADLYESFLNVLLPLNGVIKAQQTNTFPFKKERILRLCNEMCKLLEGLPGSLVGVRSPVMVFGSLYGRYYELLRHFQNFGTPDDTRMETFDYVFLGNYVDKGYNSLELICLLFSLKLKYPEHIVLLRGSHEDAKVNRIFGLAEECAVRLGENVNDPSSVYSSLNKVFDLFPLAALVQEKILCVHSGIGGVKTLNDIDLIARPQPVGRDKQIVDLLWSDTNMQAGSDLMGYDPTRISDATLNSFLENHRLLTIVRSKQSLTEGFEADGNKISIFSVSNYGKCGNNAAILKITKNLEFVPCVLQPVSQARGSWVTDTVLKTGSIQFTEEEQQLRKKMFSMPKKR